MPSSAPPPPAPKSILKKHPSSFFSDMQQLQQKRDSTIERLTGGKDDPKDKGVTIGEHNVDMKRRIFLLISPF